MLNVIHSEGDMREALRQRRLTLRLTQEEVEHRIGLTRGHLGKVENGDKRWGKKPFSMTATLEWMLECYGLRLVLVEASDDQLDQLDKVSRERIGKPVIVSSTRARRCPKTVDMFRKVPDQELAA